MTPEPVTAAQWRALATARAAAGDPDTETAWLRALALDPGDALAHGGLGRWLAGQGDLDDARFHLERAVALAPDLVPAWLDLGRLHRRLGAAEAAADCLAQAVGLKPDRPLLANELAMTLVAAGRPDRAAEALNAALGRHPAQALLWANRASLDLDADRIAAAQAAARRATLLAPDLAAAWDLRGLGARRADCRGSAVAAGRRAVVLDPGQARFWTNLGVALRDAGDDPGAVAAHRRALARCGDDRPTAAGVGENLAHALLTLGDWPAGWDAFAARHDVPAWRDGLGVALRDSRLPPRWPADPAAPLPTGRLLVVREQGVGDVIMGAAVLADLRRTAPDLEVTLWAGPRLAPLLARSFPGIRVEAGPETPGDHRAVADQWCALFDLWRVFRRQPGDGRADPWLVPDPVAVARWRDRLAGLGPGRRFGLSWRGGSTALERRRRGTSLADWLPLLRRPDLVWVNLQYGDRAGELAAELAALARDHGVVVADWPDAVADLDDFAAQIAALDGVVTMDNTTAHYAGALGRRVWTLIPSVPDWRWGRTGTQTPWYPTMGLVRQAPGMPWSAVLAGLAAAL